MIMSYEPSNIWQAYYNFFVKPAATSQSSYKVFAILRLFCIAKIILYLIDDATIILQVADTRL
jgi:hypothetical protein